MWGGMAKAGFQWGKKSVGKHIWKFSLNFELGRDADAEKEHILMERAFELPRKDATDQGGDHQGLTLQRGGRLFAVIQRTRVD